MARSNLESARANLLNQQALLARAQAMLANDRRQAERLTELYGKGLVSAQDRDNARTAYEASQAAVRPGAQVEVARVQITTTESQVRWPRPRSPSSAPASGWPRCGWTTRGARALQRIRGREAARGRRRRSARRRRPPATRRSRS